MMDMREFQEKLEQLMELAAKQEKNLNNEQILEIFGLNQLSPQQLQSLYEYLRIQGIRIQGADLAPMDIGKALDPQEEQEEEKKPVILEAEDEQCLKEYEEMLRQIQFNLIIPLPYTVYDSYFPTFDSLLHLSIYPYFSLLAPLRNTQVKWKFHLFHLISHLFNGKSYLMIHRIVSIFTDNHRYIITHIGCYFRRRIDNGCNAVIRCGIP